jgi:cytochrome P450
MATDATTSLVPDHVPPELLWDHSLEDFTLELDDPFIAASRLHQGPDVFWAPKLPHGKSGWVITRHALQQEAFVDHEHFTSKGGSGLGALLGVPLHLVPLEYDPPQHTSYRRILNPFFTPKAVGLLESAVRETCARLIARFESSGSCEFISEFAIPFPSYIFLSLVGMPTEMAPQFLAWEHDLFRGSRVEDRIAAGRGVLHYLQGFIKEQRINPRTDLLKGIVSARIDSSPLSDDEILGMLYTLYVGGLDTVYSTLGWTMRHLARDEDLQQRLRADLELLPQAVDEFSRAYSVVSTMRHVEKDLNFHGVSMLAGDLVVLPLYLAGRDPEEYQNPHEIDLDRRPSALTFASGVHLCLGRQLARREMRIALEAFLTRFDHIHVSPGETYSYHAGVTFGVDRLPLAWTRIK